MTKIKGPFQLLSIAVIILLGCAAYVLDDAQGNLRQSFASGDFKQTASLMSNLEAQDVYKGKDAVLLNLEQGSIQHFAGNYKASNQYLEQAEYTMEDLFTKSISRAIKSFVVNDNTLEYDGEDYEDVYLNIFKALNYMHLDDLEGALVETRRVSFKLSQLNTKYSGLVEALSEADTTSSDPNKWKTGNTNVQNSAFAHYLSTVLYAKTGKPDDARISLSNLFTSYSDQASLYSGNPPSRKELSDLQNPNAYNTLVTVFSGRSPEKEQNDLRFYFAEIDTYLKYSLPELHLYNSQVDRIQISVDGAPASEVHLIENMDLVAKEVYKVKEPIIYARTIVRATLKAIASNSTSNRIAKENETLGQVFNLLGKVAQEATEKADVRGWQTMPGKVHATTLKLPPGEHILDIQYLSRSGAMVHSARDTVQTFEGNQLDLVESIYWN